MKKFIGVAAGLMVILVVNEISAWRLEVLNSRFNNTVRIDAKFASALCRDDYAIFIKPGDGIKMEVGLCDLKSVHVNYPWGEDMYFDKNTGNPVNGLGIITINRGKKNNRGQSLEKYKVVSKDVMKEDDRKLAQEAVGQRG